MSELRKNDVYTANITGYTSKGEGVCRIEGRAVFVKGALAGEQCEVKILKATKTAVYGRLERVISPSEHRTVPECPTYRTCGGCGLMHMDYEEELRFKKEKVDAALRRIGGIDLETRCINGAQETNGYRNKAIYAVGTENGKVVTGFFRRHTHDIVPTERCLIQAEYSDRAAQAVRDWMNKYRIPPYDGKTGAGTVRHVFARYAFQTGQGQVTLVSGTECVPHIDELVKTILGKCPETKSIVLNVNKTKGNTVLAGSFETVWGDGYIDEKICGSVFRLSPRSFCQVNIAQAQRLYEKAVEYAGLNGRETVIDLYCGTGTITLCLAKKAGEVIGAEIVDAAVEDARHNAERNGVHNADFICADASQAAKHLKQSGTKPEVLVVDPPRKGLAADVIETIADMSPKRVVYVSCEPSTLARDLCLFARCGYIARAAEAYDLFPRTYHVETVALLSRETNPLTVEVKMEVETGEVKEHPTYKRIQEYVQNKYGFKVHTAYIAEVKRMVGVDMHKAPNAVEQRKHEYHPCPPEKVEAIKDALWHFGLISE